MENQKVSNGSTGVKDNVYDRLIRQDGSSDIDPTYKYFLQHLTEDGDTLVLHVPDGDHGAPAYVRYEEEDPLSHGDAKANRERSCVTSDKAADVSAGHSFPMEASSVMNNTSEVDDSYATFLSLVKFKDGFMVIEPEPGVTIVYEQEEKTPAGYDVLRASSSTAEKEPLVVALGNMEGDNVMNTDEDNIKSECKMDGPASENMDSTDVICIDKRDLAPYTELSLFQKNTELSDLKACEDDQEEAIALSCGKPAGSSTFDEKLNAVLTKPYDKREYKELLRRANDRKPVRRQRHLRNTSKHYATGEVGLSYLDHYQELAAQLDSSDCDESRLHLLRKLFFWLENLCHEGAYMPWINKRLASNPIAADDFESESESEPILLV